MKGKNEGGESRGEQKEMGEKRKGEREKCSTAGPAQTRDLSFYRVTRRYYTCIYRKCRF